MLTCHLSRIKQIMKNSVLAILLLYRVLYLAMPIDGAAIDNYNEALNYCINEGPMEMPPSYGSHFQRIVLPGSISVKNYRVTFSMKCQISLQIKSFWRILF